MKNSFKLEVEEVFNDELSMIELRIKDVRKKLTKEKITLGEDIATVLFLQEALISVCECLIDPAKQDAFKEDI